MLSVAMEFAALLDENRYEEAGKLMADDCRYTYYEGSYEGRDAIVNMYRQMQKQALEIMNEHSTVTDVEQTGPGTYILHALDRVRIDDLRHESRYDEVVTIEDGLVTSIEYRMIRGEAEKLREFYRAAGLS